MAYGEIFYNLRDKNLSSVAMATEFDISRPMAKGQNLLLGAVLGWNQQPKAHTLGRTQLALGASKLAKWHAGRPKKEISVKYCPAQKNA